jgi:LysR family transcriptional regulator (chromosome initiation inhibitor)
MCYLRRAQLLETDLAAELAAQQSAPLTPVLALNADSIGTLAPTRCWKPRLQ